MLAVSFRSRRAFRRGLTLRQLREALGRWRRRTRGLNPLGLTEGSLLASADLQESSSSSTLPTASQVCVVRCVLGKLQRPLRSTDRATLAPNDLLNFVNKRRTLFFKWTHNFD